MALSPMSDYQRMWAMWLALGLFVAIIFSINGSILGGVMSKINRDKWLEIWEPERYVMSRRDKWPEIWGPQRYVTSLTYFGCSTEGNICSFDRFCDNFYSFDSGLCKFGWRKIPKICFFTARAAKFFTCRPNVMSYRDKWLDFETGHVLSRRDK